MNRNTFILLVIFLSIFNFKAMAGKIDLYCEPYPHNKDVKQPVFISFDIESQKAYRLIGYDSSSDYNSYPIKRFVIEPHQILIYQGNDKVFPAIHIISRRDLSYTYQPEQHSYTIYGSPEAAREARAQKRDDKFSCTKETKMQF